ncbi:MAG: DnaA/Hda family protein [Rhodobacteraceae bacterium]|nr:DnaA/Hda family protein [Paracoccaceae bacterium]
MPDQLSFDLQSRPALSREDFLVGPSNAVAVAMIDNPGAWASGKLVISGPSGAGKTHLAHVWAGACGGRIVSADSLAQADILKLSQTPVAVEDVPDIATDMDALRALFHLHNLLAEARRPMVLTGEGPPGQWHLALADMQSRVQAAQYAPLSQPDDRLLGALLGKLFRDRQLHPPAEVIRYVLPRMERSYAAAARLVAEIDRAALARKRPITRKLVAEVLGGLPDLS